MSKLYFTYSAMNAGKSAILLQAAHNYKESGMGVSLWTYQDPEGGSPAPLLIKSRIGLQADANPFRPDTDLFDALNTEVTDKQISAAFFDEAQFLTSDQVWQLAKVSDDLGIPVLCYGLRTDFQGRLFEGAAALLAIADDLREARTICHCGRKATMNLRRDDVGTAVVEGDQVGLEKSNYVSLCRKHWRQALEG